MAGDGNEGNERSLREHWKHDPKIAWGTPGDWTRCVRAVMNAAAGEMTLDQVQGYCQNLHKEVTGVYTGSRLNPGNQR